MRSVGRRGEIKRQTNGAAVQGQAVLYGSVLYLARGLKWELSINAWLYVEFVVSW